MECSCGQPIEISVSSTGETFFCPSCGGTLSTPSVCNCNCNSSTCQEHGIPISWLQSTIKQQVENIGSNMLEYLGKCILKFIGLVGLIWLVIFISQLTQRAH